MTGWSKKRKGPPRTPRGRRAYAIGDVHGRLDLLEQLLDAIEREARLLKCIYVKIDPAVRTDTTTGHLLLHALERRHKGEIAVRSGFDETLAHRPGDLYRVVRQ